MIPKLSNTSKGLSFIVFARNEAFDFLEILESLKELGKRLTFPIEIVAVDDGSTDQTFDQLNDYFRRGDNPYLIRIITQPPLGISSAIVEGMRFITYDKYVPIPGHFMFDAVS